MSKGKQNCFDLSLLKQDWIFLAFEVNAFVNSSSWIKHKFNIFNIHIIYLKLGVSLMKNGNSEAVISLSWSCQYAGMILTPDTDQMPTS